MVMSVCYVESKNGDRKWRSKMAIENGDRKMAIGEDGRSKRLLLLLLFLAYFLTFSLLLSILFLLR